MNKKDFEINIDNIDVEEIMKQIRQNIKDKGYVEDKKISEFDFTPEIKEGDELKNNIEMLNRLWNINLEREILSRNRFFSFGKKVIRKLLRWYTVPIMQDQIIVNSYMVRIINDLYIEYNHQKKLLEEKEKRIAELEGTAPFDMDYLAFENKYRGSEESIQKLQEKFLRLFAGKDNILDIGCGRGEFIKILLNSGKQKVLGIDLNKQMVEKCQKDKLPVKYGDGIKYLEENENLNLGGIFSSQVIEHLKPSQILKFIKGAYKNLQEGSPLVLETINPMTLSTQTMAYTLDLTHKQYVHPFTIEMLLKEYGFKKVEFIYSSPNDLDNPILKNSDMDDESLKNYNEKIRKMYEILFGYQDYAVIGWK